MVFSKESEFEKALVTILFDKGWEYIDNAKNLPTYYPRIGKSRCRPSYEIAIRIKLNQLI